MTRVRIAKTNFTAGEVTPQLLGRTDLRGYENGAARLRNVTVFPTGGVQRRPGLEFLDRLPAAGRLIPFRFSAAQEYVLVLLPNALWVYLDGVRIAAQAAPWSAAHIANLTWAQSLDTLIVCHPDMPPQRIERLAPSAWRIAPFAFAIDSQKGRNLQPYFRFAPPAVKITPAGASAAKDSIVSLTADGAAFLPDHVGMRFRYRGREMEITAVSGPQTAQARLVEAWESTWFGQPHEDWLEPAFSSLRGWPATAAFHEERLAFGGSRDLPNRVWLSRIAAIGDFSTPEGLDDEAIEFALMSGDASAIVGLHSGLDLLIFTKGAEWVLGGSPLTPANAQVRAHSRIGSSDARYIPALQVEGATIFAARGGAELRELIYSDLQQVYQANDLGLLAPHILGQTLDMAYDPQKRLLHCALADGRLATVTLYRTEQITAWTQAETDGRFESLVGLGGHIYAIVDRSGARFLERFADDHALDCALKGQSAEPARVWAGLSHLEGRSVRILADGVDCGNRTVTQGRITLERPARRIEVGLPFRFEIEALPFALMTGEGTSQGTPVRLVRAILRVENSPAFHLDVGLGPQPVIVRRTDQSQTLDAPPPAFTGDLEVRGLGWVRSGPRPLWRIVQDAAYPFTLLSVIQEIKVNAP